jgi:hypothetical protein
MAVIDALIFAGAAGFALVIVITIIVIVGIHREERYHTLANRTAPGAMAQLARLVLGRYVRKESDDSRSRECLDEDAYTPRRSPWPWE